MRLTNQMGWRQFVMDLESLEPTRVEELFSRHGALAVTLSDGGDDPVLEPAPGETPLWNKTRITGLFDADRDLDALKSDLRRTFDLEKLPPSRIESLADRPWEREWLKEFRPMRFGARLWVSPHGCDVPADNATVVRLDPGLAFGTGTHATTGLCLRWLDSADLSTARVLDVGCGSGVLAIAALLLGAGDATALDIDHQAITATRRNATANGVADRLTTGMSTDALSGKFDVVVANILAKPLIDLAPVLARHCRPGGQLVLSGILAEQADAVSNAYRDWVSFEPPVVLEGWALLTGARR